MTKIKWIVMIVFLILLFYSRLINLSWGLPYPFHPDERNMANAIQNLNCKSQMSNLKCQNCMNPHFFAYGQFPLYLGYFLIQIYHLLIGKFGLSINFSETTIALRFISATASITNVFALYKIVQLNLNSINSKFKNYYIVLLFIFSPALIQFAHFGTTESLLMLFYSLIIYLCLLFIESKIRNSRFLILSSLFLALACATKVSSSIFIFPIFIAVLLGQEKEWMVKLFDILKLLSFALVFFVIFSPYNFIDFKEFLGSMRYESDVALGSYIVFYTRQFINTIPVIFQSGKIFPFALGWPTYILFILGFIFLPWNNRINLLRLSFLIYFIFNSFLFAKWTRFMAPVFPIMIIFAAVFLQRLRIANFIKIIIIFFALIPGVAYLAIYQSPDVRFTASDWIYKNIKNGSYILSETANVVDVPIPTVNNMIPEVNYNYVSFNFYDLDIDPQLRIQLNNYITRADYIFIPSRRIFANHRSSDSPRLAKYYKDLFSGRLGFKEVAKFSSFPRITIMGKTLVEFDDEAAEETWTVFDHPVIRIYERI